MFVLRAEAAMATPDPGPAVREAVRDAVASLLRDAPDDDDVLRLVRAIEFEADRIEVFGTSGVEAQLARARIMLVTP
jgi:hypothetical protein